MESLLAFANLLLGLGVVVMVIMQARSGVVSILSSRNVFLFGVMIFQIISAVLCFTMRDYWETNVGDPVRAGIIFTLTLTLFLVFFEVVYRTGWFSFGLPRRLMTRFAPPGDTTMLALSIGAGAVALLMKFVLIYIPVINVLFGLLATSFAAASAALFCWVWSKRLGNPVLWTLGVFILGAAFVVSTYHGFGRRDLLSVAASCLWGAYHGHFKYLSWRRAIVPMSLIGGVGMMLVAAFTATRSVESLEMSQSEMNSRMANADLKAGLIDLLEGQYAAPISLWLIESRPGHYPYDTLHTFRYAITNIIPRDYYPGGGINKPVSLGLTMVPEAGLGVGRSDGFTVGPGLMGHIFNDNPWIALPFYAALLGVIMHTFDRLLTLQPKNPFVIIPVGAALGELVAISRGEMGLYLFRTVLGSVGIYLGLFVILWTLRLLGWRYQAAVDTQSPEHEDAPAPHTEYAEQLS